MGTIYLTYICKIHFRIGHTWRSSLLHHSWYARTPQHDHGSPQLCIRHREYRKSRGSTAGCPFGQVNGWGNGKGWILRTSPVWGVGSQMHLLCGAFCLECISGLKQCETDMGFIIKLTMRVCVFSVFIKRWTDSAHGMSNTVQVIACNHTKNYFHHLIQNW